VFLSPLLGLPLPLSGAAASTVSNSFDTGLDGWTSTGPLEFIQEDSTSAQ
jgi:hypothetical protein